VTWGMGFPKMDDFDGRYDGLIRLDRLVGSG